MWTSIAIWDILDHILSAKELDNIVYPLLNELKSSVMELQIYFKTSNFKHFEEIMENMILIKRKLGEVYFSIILIEIL